MTEVQSLLRDVQIALLTELSRELAKRYEESDLRYAAQYQFLRARGERTGPEYQDGHRDGCRQAMIVVQDRLVMLRGQQ